MLKSFTFILEAEKNLAKLYAWNSCVKIPTFLKPLWKEKLYSE